MTLNDKAWSKYFEATSALQEIKRKGYTYVTSGNLKELGGREARLMAKLDTLDSRPKVFKENALTIFSVKNGKYIVFKDTEKESYFEFGKQLERTPVQRYDSRVNLRVFDSYPRGRSLNESQAISFAFISSLLKTFTADENLRLTIRGKSFTDNFGFDLRKFGHHVNVAGVQIEVDAGYKSDNAIYLIEAKTGRKDNFHIRQLYYPYLEWSNRSRKNIVPIFFIYSNGKYYFTEFSFGKNFGDMEIVRAKCYTINESPTLHVNFADFLRRVPEEEEPKGVPYPQANDLDKVVDSVKLIGSGVNDKFQISEFFEFAGRQGDYYANAGRYLGFVERDDHGFVLTRLGREFVQLESLSERTEVLLSQMLARPIFRSVFNLLIENKFNLASITKAKIAKVIDTHSTLSTSTSERRASTVQNWLKWILDNCQIATM